MKKTKQPVSYNEQEDATIELGRALSLPKSHPCFKTALKRYIKTEPKLTPRDIELKEARRKIAWEKATGKLFNIR